MNPPLAQEQKGAEGPNDEAKKAYIWSHSEGLYMTYTIREMKVAACRSVIRFLMQILLVGLCALVYFLLWNVSSLAILICAAASCGGTLAGITSLFPSCVGGSVVSLLLGFRIGNTDADMHVKWTL